MSTIHTIPVRWPIERAGQSFRVWVECDFDERGLPGQPRVDTFRLSSELPRGIFPLAEEELAQACGWLVAEHQSRMGRKS